MNLFFEKCSPGLLDNLLSMQSKELKYPSVDFIEEGIATYNADFIRISSEARTIGYACLGTYEYYKGILLEYYLIDEYRKFAGDIVKELSNRFNCSGWLVNTKDTFTLPVMLDLKLNYEIDAYIFGVGNSENADEFDECTALNIAKKEELEEIYELISLDGFYTGGGKETLIPRFEANELYSLRINDKLAGTGFITVLRRTPDYADIAMIISPDERHKGLGTALVKALISRCMTRNLIPTAVCSYTNTLSRKTLQRAGFRLEGCMLKAKFR